ncbi:Speedy Protein E5, partial [Manis pentadactyla]
MNRKDNSWTLSFCGFFAQAAGTQQPSARGSGRRTQRERSAALQESEEAATGEEDAWDLDMLCGLKMRLKRRRVSPVRAPRGLQKAACYLANDMEEDGRETPNRTSFGSSMGTTVPSVFCSTNSESNSPNPWAGRPGSPGEECEE